MRQELPFWVNIALMCGALYVFFSVNILWGIYLMLGLMLTNAIMWRYGKPTGESE